MKTITICGSMMFLTRMNQLKTELEDLGFNVYAPHEEESGIDYTALSKQEFIDLKQFYIDAHIEKIKASDAILLANYTKNHTKDYIGSNTFLEMAFAYLLKKPIFILNNIPNQPNTVEIEGLKPIALNGNLNSLVKSMNKGKLCRMDE